LNHFNSIAKVKNIFSISHYEYKNKFLIRMIALGKGKLFLFFEARKNEKSLTARWLFSLQLTRYILLKIHHYQLHTPDKRTIALSLLAVFKSFQALFKIILIKNKSCEAYVRGMYE
jgi:hypothetical protein